MTSEPDLLDRDEPLGYEPDAGDDAPPQEPIRPDDDHGEGEPVRWVTVGAFWSTGAAHIARLRVEAEGIDCVLFDEFLVATDWLYANAAGGIKLQVPHFDAARAHELLTRLPAWREDREDEESAGQPDTWPAAPSTPSRGVCPRCGSADVYRAWFSRRVFFGLFLFGLPLPLPIPARRCGGCGHEWWRRRERWHGSGRAGFDVVPTANELLPTQSAEAGTDKGDIQN